MAEQQAVHHGPPEEGATQRDVTRDYGWTAGQQRGQNSGKGREKEG